jgi:hypothetical protein
VTDVNRERETLQELLDNVTLSADRGMRTSMTMLEATHVLTCAIAFHDWTNDQGNKNYSAQDVVGWMLDYAKELVNLDESEP